MSDLVLQNPIHMTSGQKASGHMTSSLARHERPIWIWDGETAHFVWANGEGVKFWSQNSLECLQASPIDKAHPAFVTILEALQTDIPLKGIELDLYFPDQDGGVDCLAVCRWATLQERRAIIIELLGISAHTAKAINGHQQEGLFAESELPSQRISTPQSADHIQTEDPILAKNILDTEDEIQAEDYPETVADLQSDAGASKIEPAHVNGHDLADGVNNASTSNTTPSHKSTSLKSASVKAPTLKNTVSLKNIRSQASGPSEQLHELARLIKEAGGTNDDVLQAAGKKAAELKAADLENHHPPLSSTEKDSSSLSTNNLGAASPEVSTTVARANDLDMIALSGVGDQDELEDILDQSDEAIALISLQKVLYANRNFVAEFGYGDVTALINDGTDWLFPHSRSIFRIALEGTNSTRISGGTESAPIAEKIEFVRLRSGRKLKRHVQIEPIRLTKFDRTLLLLRLSEGFVAETEQAGNDLLVVPPTQSYEVQRHEAQSDEAESHQVADGSDMYSISMMNAVNHEVRTPLNVIIGFSELMHLEQFGPLGHEKYRGYVKDIYNSAQHALSLINDLLDLTKLQAGKWDIEKRELDLNELTRQQVSLMRELAAKAQVRFYSEFEENLPLVMADERALKQILLNLISNAIKYNTINGRITVSTERLDSQTVQLRVTDTGAGMSSPDMEKALEPFSRITNQLSLDNLSSKSLGDSHLKNEPPQNQPISELNQGTGLGLPIAKALAIANDMDFQITSEMGTGTTITLLIKL